MNYGKLQVALLVLLVSTATVAAETLKLGLNYPQTGRYKDQGLQQRLGAFLAMEEINAAGGILGRQLELVIRDTRGDPARGARNTAELIDRHGVSMVFGGSSSAVAIASGEAARERDRVYFGTLTYSNETTGSAGHSHMFREPYNAWMSAKALGKYMNREFSGKKHFYITADYTWGWSTEESMRRFTNTTDPKSHPGVTTPFPQAYIADFKAALEQARASGAEVLVMVLFGDDMVRALNIAHEMGLKDEVQVVVPNITLGMARQVGPTIMEGVIGAAPWTWQVPHKYGFERGKQFVASFSSRFEMMPSSSAASAYSIIYQYKDAVERARSTETAALIKALEGHRYQFLKDEQEWRAFDHQNVQTVYVVKSRPRDQVVTGDLGDDYFEIVDQMAGNEAAQTLAEWQEERRQGGAPLALR